MSTTNTPRVTRITHAYKYYPRTESLHRVFRSIQTTVRQADVSLLITNEHLITLTRWLRRLENFEEHRYLKYIVTSFLIIISDTTFRLKITRNLIIECLLLKFPELETRTLNLESL